MKTMRMFVLFCFIGGGFLAGMGRVEADIVKRELYTDSKGKKVYGYVYDKGRTRFARSPEYSAWWGGGSYYRGRARVGGYRGHGGHGRRSGGRGGIGVLW